MALPPPPSPVAPVVDGGSCGIGCIVGIAAAVFVGLLLLLACAFLFCFKKAGENGSGIKPGTTKTGSAAESAYASPALQESQLPRSTSGAERVSVRIRAQCVR